MSEAVRVLLGDAPAFVLGESFETDLKGLEGKHKLMTLQ